MDESSPGTEWEHVARLCDFNPKSSKQAKDVSRMRSVLISLKQAPLVRWWGKYIQHYKCNIFNLLREAVCSNWIMFKCVFLLFSLPHPPFGPNLMIYLEFDHCFVIACFLPPVSWCPNWEETSETVVSVLMHWEFTSSCTAIKGLFKRLLCEDLINRSSLQPSWKGRGCKSVWLMCAMLALNSDSFAFLWQNVSW